MPADAPFAKKAAMASWIIPLVVMMFDTMSRPLMAEAEAKGGAAVVLGLAAILALGLAIGLILGIVAVSGVRKHGRKGIYTPAIIGIALNGGFLLLIGLGFALAMSRNS